MDPARIDFTGKRPVDGPAVRKGRRWSHLTRWFDSEVAINMSAGITWLCEIRPEPGGVLSATVAVAVGGTPTPNEVTLSMTAVVTDALTPGRYVYELVDATAKDSWLTGDVLVLPEVANP
jgi:hypothetical protein